MPSSTTPDGDASHHEVISFRFDDSKRLKQFLLLPRSLYKGDPNWTPEIYLERKDFHNPKKQPIRRPMDITYFLALRDGKPIGRITAHSYPAHNKTHEDNVGFFGFFECVNEPAVAASLFDAAANRLREMGFDTMRGPTDFSTNEEVGSLIWQETPAPAMVMMKYNPMYHQGLYEGAGFHKAKDLLAYDLNTNKWPNEKIRRSAELARRRGATLRTARLAKKGWADELEILNRMYRAAWEKNWGFVPLSDEEFAHSATEMRSIVDPEFVLVAEVHGEPVGWAFSLPDLHSLLRHTKGGLLRSLWHLLIRKTQRRWDIIRRARVTVLGIVPEFRRRGIEALFYERTFELSIHHAKIPDAEISWVLEDNPNMVNGAKMMQADHYKTYRVYDRAL